MSKSKQLLDMVESLSSSKKTPWTEDKISAELDNFRGVNDDLAPFIYRVLNKEKLYPLSMKTVNRTDKSSKINPQYGDSYYTFISFQTPAEAKTFADAIDEIGSGYLAIVFKNTQVRISHD